MESEARPVAEIRFFIDDESGEPWMIFGDAGDIKEAAIKAGETWVWAGLERLVKEGADGDTFTLTFKRQDMTQEEVDALPDI